MTTRNVTGWLLIAGPVLTFVVIGVLYSALIGDQETPETSVKEMMAKPELAKALLTLGSIVFVSIFAGLALLARSMQGDDNAGGVCASLAGLIFVGLATIAIAATGLSAGALEASEKSVELAVIIEAASNAIFSGLWLFWGIGSLLLGGAMLRQKYLGAFKLKVTLFNNAAIAWIFVLFGIYVVISSLIDPGLSEDLGDSIGFGLWILMSLATAAAGVLTLRAKEAS